MEIRQPHQTLRIELYSIQLKLNILSQNLRCNLSLFL